LNLDSDWICSAKAFVCFSYFIFWLRLRVLDSADHIISFTVYVKPYRIVSYRNTSYLSRPSCECFSYHQPNAFRSRQEVQCQN